MREIKGSFRQSISNDHSIFFITLHKAASSLFSAYVLKNVPGFEHVDYETIIFQGNKEVDLNFESKGVVYGAIRLLENPRADTYRLTVQVSEKDFINDKKCIFMTRDPRDILVSSFFSFGYSHSLSPDEKIREKQIRSRNKIQKQGIDGFVVSVAPGVAKRFEVMFKLMKKCKNYVFLKYEDMINNYDLFYDKLSLVLPLKEEVKEQLYTLTRPEEKEDISKHKRSGKVGGFREKLKQETIKELNNQFKKVLKRFDYTF